MDKMKVWIDQDLCTGDGLCVEIVPDIFFMGDDGLAYVKDISETANVSEPLKRGAEGLASVPEARLDEVIDAAEECPGECIFIESCTN
jgi:ferredoxin